MPMTTFVSPGAWDRVPDVACIKEWLPLAQKVLGQRLCVEERESRKWRLFGPDRVTKLYSVLIDLGHGEAQIINFAPRDGSDWTINGYVPAQEVSAWLLGVVTGAEALKEQR